MQVENWSIIRLSHTQKLTFDIALIVMEFISFPRTLCRYRKQQLYSSGSRKRMTTISHYFVFLIFLSFQRATYARLIISSQNNGLEACSANKDTKLLSATNQKISQTGSRLRCSVNLLTTCWECWWTSPSWIKYNKRKWRMRVVVDSLRLK